MTQSGRQPESVAANFSARIDLVASAVATPPPESVAMKQSDSASTSLGIDFLAGCLGGAAGVLAGHPFDTVKVRLQTAASVASVVGVAGGATPANSSTFRLFSAILRDESARGLYKGISSPLASVAFLNAIIFGAHSATYKWLQGGGENVLEEDGGGAPLRHHFLAGFVAGSAQAVLASPMEMLKLRAQLNQSGTHSLSPYACFRQIVAEGGARALTRGFWATQLRDSTGVAVYFTVYEMLTRRMSGGSDTETMEASSLLNPIQLMLAGGLAGTASWLCNYPVDVVKTRLQASRTPLAYAALIREIYADRGLSAFFVGLESTLLRAFPTNAATFFTVEWTYRYFHKFQNSHNEQQQQPQQQPFAANNNKNKPKKRSNPTRGDGHLSFYADLWTRNSFLLPEAGCTLIDPIVSRCRKSGHYNSAIAAAL